MKLKLLILSSLGHHSMTWSQTILLLLSVIIFIQLINRRTKKQSGITKEQLDAWHNDPANWRAGFIYYNKKDPRLFPPKRVSMLGWTVNFANPLSVLMMVALIAAIFVIANAMN